MNLALALNAVPRSLLGVTDKRTTKRYKQPRSIPEPVKAGIIRLRLEGRPWRDVFDYVRRTGTKAGNSTIYRAWADYKLKGNAGGG